MEDTLFYDDIDTSISFEQVAFDYQIPYLKEASDEEITTEASKKYLEGILYGVRYMPIVPLIISSKKYKKNIHVLFVIDMHCPCVYLCNKTWNALGFTFHNYSNNSAVSEAKGSIVLPEEDENYKKINDTFIYKNFAFNAFTSTSDSPYYELNVIGADFLKTMRSQLKIDYRMNELTIEFT